ncbi:MAG: CsiV family protein [Cellvibrionaceae bacterium]
MKRFIPIHPSTGRLTSVVLGRILTSALIAQAAYGQHVLGQPLGNSEAEQWYQVEMIIFGQGDGPNNTDEAWRTDIELDYPANWLELVDPTHGDASDPLEATATTGNGEPDETGGRALALLPRQELTLVSEARRLSRNQRYRVLFHEAWLQPMVENRREPSILITGGEAFDQHHELQGSVNLYLRTYLHIETNLWLSRFATNFGQERQPWPRLPLPPNQPIDPDGFTELTDINEGAWHQLNEGNVDEYEAILSRPYVVENIVVLKQQRRMRSNELHYLDHPLMGVLVKLTPYEQSGNGEASR